MMGRIACARSSSRLELNEIVYVFSLTLHVLSHEQLMTLSRSVCSLTKSNQDFQAHVLPVIFTDIAELFGGDFVFHH